MRPLNIIEVVNVRWWNACAYYGILLSEGLKKLGHNVFVVGNRNSHPIEQAKLKNIPVIEKYRLSNYNPVSIIKTIFGIKKIIDDHDIDIINLHRGQAAIAFSIAVKLSKRNCKIIRTWGDQRMPRRNIFVKMQNLRFTNYIITTTGKLEKYFIKVIGIDPQKITTILGGVDESLFFDYPANINREEVIKIGMLARFSHIKGHFTLIQAFKKVAELRKDVRLYIAGKIIRDQKKKILEDYADKLGLSETVTITGYVDEKRDFINSLDLCLVASEGSEMISRVLFEYMAMSKAVVGTRINAVAEIIEDGKNGYLAEVGNPDDIANKILLALEDFYKLQEMGKKSRELIENKYTMLKFAQDTEKIYYQVIGTESQF